MAGAGGELLSIYTPVKEQLPKNLRPCGGMELDFSSRSSDGFTAY